MSVHDRDFLLRQIRQLAALLARLAGERQQPDWALQLRDANRTINLTGQDLVGPIYLTLVDADIPTTTMLVSDRDKLFALGLLTIQMAELHALRGDTAAHDRDQAKGLALMLEATQRYDSPPEEVIAELQRLATPDAVARLGPRYRQMLTQWAPKGG